MLQKIKKPPTLPKVCEQCGAPFLAQRSNARFCDKSTCQDRKARTRVRRLEEELAHATEADLEGWWDRGDYRSITSLATKALTRSSELSKRRSPIIGEAKNDAYSLAGVTRPSLSFGDERVFVKPKDPMGIHNVPELNDPRLARVEDEDELVRRVYDRVCLLIMLAALRQCGFSEAPALAMAA